MQARGVVGAVIGLWLLGVAGAQAAIFQCEVNGKKVYQDQPCNGAASTEIDPHPATAGICAPQETTSDGGDLLAESARIRLAIEKGTIVTGMNADQVRQSWGSPTHVNYSYTGGSNREQWVYRRGKTSAQYVYLVSGRVTSWN